MFVLYACVRACVRACVVVVLLKCKLKNLAMFKSKPPCRPQAVGSLLTTSTAAVVLAYWMAALRQRQLANTAIAITAIDV